MRYQVKTLAQAIAFLLTKIPTEADKLKIVKLLFLADKYSLMKYGRTITGDTYVAVRHGPMGSLAQNLLNFDKINVTPDEIKYLVSLVDQEGEVVFRARKAPCDFEMLSDTDKEALAEIARVFGKKDTFNLVDYSHEYPEWKQHESFLQANPKKSKRIKSNELFTVIDHRLGSLTKADAIAAREAFVEC